MKSLSEALSWVRAAVSAESEGGAARWKRRTPSLNLLSLLF